MNKPKATFSPRDVARLERGLDEISARIEGYRAALQEEEIEVETIVELSDLVDFARRRPVMDL